MYSLATPSGPSVFWKPTKIPKISGLFYTPSQEADGDATFLLASACEAGDWLGLCLMVLQDHFPNLQTKTPANDVHMGLWTLRHPSK